MSNRSAAEWASSQTPWIWILVVFYLLLVKFYRYCMPTIKHGLLPTWYFFMGILHLGLLLAFLPEMVIVFSKGWSASVCDGGSLYTRTVILLFVISKVVDLVETLLIIIEGRSPLNIHVFHHVVTLLYIWHSYAQQSSMARWFVFTNLISHVVLYSYLSPRKFGLRPCWLMVALAQMTSLFTCFFAITTAQRVIDAGGKCDVNYKRLSLDKLIIVIFITIFADFYHQKFRNSSSKTGKRVIPVKSGQSPTRRNNPKKTPGKYERSYFIETGDKGGEASHGD